MTTQSNTSAPAYRLGFAPFTGLDHNGQQTLGYPVEIGAAFHRKEREKGLVAKFAIVPEGLKNGGVLFLMPVHQEPDLLSNVDQPSPRRRAKVQK